MDFSELLDETKFSTLWEWDRKIEKIVQDYLPEVHVVYGAYWDQKPGAHHSTWDLYMPDVTDKPIMVFFNDHLNQRPNGEWRELQDYRNKYDQRVYFITEQHDIPDAYNFSGFLISEALSMKKHLSGIFDRSSLSHKFLCLNRGRRPHRTHLMSKYIQRAEGRLASYQAVGWNLPNDDVSFTDYDNLNVEYQNKLENDGMTVNTYNILHNLYRYYNMASMSIVSETTFDDHCPFITEKTLHAIVALHPCLWVSSRGTVRVLREWGIDVFDDIFDHSYDDEYGADRIDRMWKDNEKVILGGVVNEPLMDRLLENRRIILNDIPQQMVSDLSKYLVNVKEQLCTV